MTICFSLSWKHFGFLFPYLGVRGPVLHIAWLGMSLSIVQRVAAGIITPEQVPLFKELEQEMLRRAKGRYRK